MCKSWNYKLLQKDARFSESFLTFQSQQKAKIIQIQHMHGDTIVGMYIHKGYSEQLLDVSYVDRRLVMALGFVRDHFEFHFTIVEDTLDHFHAGQDDKVEGTVIALPRVDEEPCDAKPTWAQVH